MAQNTQIPDWHTEKCVQKAVRSFSSQKAEIPRKALQAAKRYNDKYIRTIRTYLKDQRITRGQFEYVGSAYEGLKIGGNLEMDILIILNGIVHPSSRVRPGFYNLTLPKGKIHDNPILEQFEGKPIEPFGVICEFYGHIKKALNTCEEIRHEIVIRSHGPAIQMDVYETNNRNKLWYSVDLVPAFKSGRNLYVAKHYDKNPADLDAWRMSHTLQEKAKFKRVYNQDSRSECVRILKAIRRREPAFHCLTSYILKTVLFYTSEEVPSDYEWTRQKLGQNVLRLLLQLERAVGAEELDNHTITGLNLLKSIKDETLTQIKSRLSCLTTDKDEFLTLLSKPVIK